MGCFHCKFAVEHCFWQNIKVLCVKVKVTQRSWLQFVLPNVKVTGQMAGITSLSLSAAADTFLCLCVLEYGQG